MYKLTYLSNSNDNEQNYIINKVLEFISNDQ